jgi:hypothetical protein
MKLELLYRKEENVSAGITHKSVTAFHILQIDVIMLVIFLIHEMGPLLGD